MYLQNNPTYKLCILGLKNPSPPSANYIQPLFSRRLTGCDPTAFTSSATLYRPSCSSCPPRSSSPAPPERA